MQSEHLRLAVIIPATDDDAALTRLLARLIDFQPTPHEIIVVDGNASITTELICRSFGATWLPCKSGRGGQLALGVAKSRADILWFLHPHCEPAPEALGVIHQCIASGAVGGYFRFRFAGARNPLRKLIERGVALRSRLTSVHLDQGIFVTRGAYDRSLGFALQPLFEEVRLVRSLKATGRFVALALPLDVSPRAWEKEGFIRRTVMNRLLALAFRCGVSPARLARWRNKRVRLASTTNARIPDRAIAAGRPSAPRR